MLFLFLSQRRSRLTPISVPSRREQFGSVLWEGDGFLALIYGPLDVRLFYFLVSYASLLQHLLKILPHRSPPRPSCLGQKYSKIKITSHLLNVNRHINSILVYVFMMRV